MRSLSEHGLSRQTSGLFSSHRVGAYQLDSALLLVEHRYHATLDTNRVASMTRPAPLAPADDNLSEIASERYFEKTLQCYKSVHVERFAVRLGC
jgi:hypothetical protein